MKIHNFISLKNANRLKNDLEQLIYYYEEDDNNKRAFYSLNLLDELYSNSLIDAEKLDELKEFFEDIRFKIEKEEKRFLNMQIEENKKLIKQQKKRK